MLINQEVNNSHKYQDSGDDYFKAAEHHFAGLVFVQLKELFFVAVAFWYATAAPT